MTSTEMFVCSISHRVGCPYTVISCGRMCLLGDAMVEWYLFLGSSLLRMLLGLVVDIMNRDIRAVVCFNISQWYISNSI